MRTYADCKESVKYELESADGKVKETLYIPKMLVEDIENTVALLKSLYEDDGGVFNGFVNFTLVYAMDFLNSDGNLDKFIKIIGDTDGNRSAEKDK